MTRNRFLYFTAAVVMTAAIPALAADEALPKAETILDRYVEVTGGKAAYEKHKSETATMSMEFVGKGIKGTGTRVADTSNNSFESMELENIGKVDAGVVNGVAWETNPMTGPRILDGPEKADRMRDSRFNAPIYWRELWKTTETTGVETVNGEECYKVILTPASGKTTTNFYSKKTGLLVKQARVVVSQMGELPVEIFAKNYKDFDGVLMPTQVSQQMMGNEILITAGNVKFNVPVAKDRYEPPAEIKKLIAK